MKRLLQKLLPKGIFTLYHHVFAWMGAAAFGFPTRKALVIGVMGTRGKTTAANFLWSIFTAAGYRVGLTGTANLRIGAKETVNPYHMTMPGRGLLQMIFARMVRAGCDVLIVETPSEGMEQHREAGIAFDSLLLNSLYPEFLAIHGRSYERLKEMNERPFAALAGQPKKRFRGAAAPKVIVVNTACDEHERFLGHTADQHVTFSVRRGADVNAESIEARDNGVTFASGGETYDLSLVGTFNVENALGAIAMARAYGIPESAIHAGLKNLQGVPGRMERIDEGQPFTVFVDYAHDAQSIEAALTASNEIAKPRDGKVVIVLGAEGGGRDVKKRPIMGELAALHAGHAVVTNVDPYEDDPLPILEDIAKGAERVGAERGNNLHVVENRREGIRKALALAEEHDVVLVTGKGAEQSIIIGGKSAPWDDRDVVREELKRLRA